MSRWQRSKLSRCTSIYAYGLISPQRFNSVKEHGSNGALRFQHTASPARANFQLLKLIRCPLTRSVQRLSFFFDTARH